MVFLQGHGIGTAQALRIWRRYGREAQARIRENPYRLAEEIPGIGFRTADAIAASLGFARDSPQRAAAGLLHALGEGVEGGGHVFLPRGRLLEAARVLLEHGGAAARRRPGAPGRPGGRGGRGGRRSGSTCPPCTPPRRGAARDLARLLRARRPAPPPAPAGGPGGRDRLLRGRRPPAPLPGAAGGGGAQRGGAGAAHLRRPGHRQDHRAARRAAGLPARGPAGPAGRAHRARRPAHGGGGRSAGGHDPPAAGGPPAGRHLRARGGQPPRDRRPGGGRGVHGGHRPVPRPARRPALPARGWCWWGTPTSSRRWGRARCCAT